jgi:hypothetical protein
VGRRRIETFQYRQVLVRLRAGDSEREMARTGLMGRDKLASFRALASRQGWLDPGSELPDDGAIAAACAAIFADLERPRLAATGRQFQFAAGQS